MTHCGSVFDGLNCILGWRYRENFANLRPPLAGT